MEKRNVPDVGKATFRMIWEAVADTVSTYPRRVAVWFDDIHRIRFVYEPATGSWWVSRCAGASRWKEIAKGKLASPLVKPIEIARMATTTIAGWEAKLFPQDHPQHAAPLPGCRGRLVTVPRRK